MSDRDALAALEIVGCPQCSGPAEVVARYVCDSTGAPMGRMRVRCVECERRFTIFDRP